MTDIVNLNRFRKQQKRVTKTRQAEQNRVLHGRTKAQKLTDQAEKSAATKKLDGHRLKDAKNSDTETD